MIGGAGEFECHDAADQVPETSWRAALGARGIAVCNVPDYGTTEVADHAIAFMLGLRRGVITFHDALRADPVAGFDFTAAPCLERLRGRGFGSIEELFETSDANSLHTPLTDETRGIVNPAPLARVKPGAVLVNTSRGPVVDLDALYAALKNGRLGGTALDAYPAEPPEPAHPLVKAYTGREPWLDGRLRNCVNRE